MLKSKRNLNAIVNMFNCEVCGKYSHPVKRPLASNPRIPEFNHEVGADIFWVNKVAFLHVVCTFTLYSQVERVLSTQGDHVRGKFMRMWTRYFGGPKKLKLDLGPEFDNVFVDQLRDTLGCEIVAVPGGAHWSHGATENKHGVLRDMCLKLLDDTPGLNPEEAMDACVAAKNCTVNVYGYSPIQLDFGYAPTIRYFPAKGEATDEKMSLVYKGYLKAGCKECKTQDY